MAYALKWCVCRIIVQEMTSPHEDTIAHFTISKVNLKDITSKAVSV